jgi:DNA-binding transcriptional LysR family regulator
MSICALVIVCPYSVIFSREENAKQVQRFDRMLGILLFLRSKQSVSAAELARHFEVSTRTIYRDLETLSALAWLFSTPSHVHSA